MTPHSPLHYYLSHRQKKQSLDPTAATTISSHSFIHTQLQSPFFALLPAEIREMIYTYALLSYSNPNRPYSRHTYYYRPGYTHARKIATELLRTCRKIYLESSLLPLILNEHVIYGGEASHGPNASSGKRHYLLNSGLKTVQRDAIRYVHVFAQQFWLEDWNERDQWGDFCRSFRPSHLKQKSSTRKGSIPTTPPERDVAIPYRWRKNTGLETLRITIRHTDWWYYLLGRGSPLALDPKKAGRALPKQWVPPSAPFEEGSWGSRFIHFHGLKCFELELETARLCKDELEEVLAKAENWTFPLGDGNILRFDREVERWKWCGSKKFKGMKSGEVEAGLQSPIHIGSQGRRSTFPSLRTGSSRHGSVVSSDDGEDETLDYLVVVLRWTSEQPKVMGDEKDMEGDEENTFEARYENRGSIFGNGEGNEQASEVGTLNTPTATIGTTNSNINGNTANAIPQPQPGQTNNVPAILRDRHAIPTYYG